MYSNYRRRDKEYGYCFCDTCRGSIRTRRTVYLHRTHGQKPVGKGDRICHCSIHPLGAIVHRNTFRSHVSRDKKNGIDFDMSGDTPGLSELLGDSRAIIEFDTIEAIRKATQLTQNLPRLDDSKSTQDSDSDISTQDIDSEAEAEEQENDFYEALDTGLDLPTDITQLSDWIQLMDGMTRSKRREMKTFFDTHFKTVILPTIWRLDSKLEDLTGLAPIWYDCCPNICIAYTGIYAGEISCPTCKTDRFFPTSSAYPKLRAVKRFQYIPLIPRLRLQYGTNLSKQFVSYRAGFHSDKRDSTQIADVFDGSLYKDFVWNDGRTDLFFQLSLDGAQVTKLQNHDVNPIILTNLSIPPDQRYKVDNIQLSILIPGPKAHKDVDSFLFPLVEEFKELGVGIDNVFNATTNSRFTLRAHLIVVSGDGPASADAIGMKKPGNASRPCHHCTIQGSKDVLGKYYLPHTDVDLAKLPLRQNLRQIITTFDAMAPGAEKTARSQDLGITRASILLQLTSLRFPESFPMDLMHCVLQNITPMIQSLWGGRRKVEEAKSNAGRQQYRKKIQRDLGPEALVRLDSVSPNTTVEKYHITQKQWDHVGVLQVNSRKLIPTELGQGPRPINTRVMGYKAMEWQAFLVRDGLSLLSDSGPEFRPFLENFALLRTIYLTAISRLINPTELIALGVNCVNFVRQFEELYYHGELSQIRVCRINMHSLLHLESHIRELGPATAFWAIPMERYIGVLKSKLSLMSNIDQDLANKMMTFEQLHILRQATVIKEVLPTSFPNNPTDIRLEYRGKDPTWEVLLRTLYGPFRGEYPDIRKDGDEVVYWKKYRLSEDCTAGSEVSIEGPGSSILRDDSYVWWMDGEVRQYGRAVVYVEVYNWEPLAVVRPWDSLNVVEDRILGTITVSGPLMGQRLLEVDRIMGLVGRIQVNSHRSVFLVGKWNGIW